MLEDGLLQVVSCNRVLSPLAHLSMTRPGLRDGVVVVRFARCRVFVLCPIRRQHW